MRGIAFQPKSVRGGTFHYIQYWDDVNRAIISEYLSHLSTESQAKHGFMASSLVVSEEENIPSSPFFALAKQLGAMKAKEDKEKKVLFWIGEIHKAHAFYQKAPAIPKPSQAAVPVASVASPLKTAQDKVARYFTALQWQFVEWANVLDRICDGNADLERTLQDLAGYILSGASHLRFIPWAYGGKGTGKSTYSMLLQTLLGLHSKTISPSELSKNSDRDRLGVKLWNKRLAVCAEAGFQQLEPELLKTLSGGDMMSVRFLYRESFDALPYHVLFLVSNDPPRLDAYDEALKDRIIALPFIHQLKDKGHLHLTGGERIEDVRKYPDTVLVREFAVWALRGLSRVMATQKVFVAPAVEAATEQFWVDTDPLTPFWETVPVDLLNEGIFKSKLRSKYEAWCESSSTRPFTNIPWNRACLSIGLVEHRKTQANIKSWFLEPKSPFGSAPQGPGNTAQGGAKQPRLNIYGDEIEGEETTGCGSSARMQIEDLLA